MQAVTANKDDMYSLLEFIYTKIVFHDYTIRDVAAVTQIPKSSVHYLIHGPMKKYCPKRYSTVKAILDIHWNQKHINGGKATQRKYMALREEKENDV